MKVDFLLSLPNTLWGVFTFAVLAYFFDLIVVMVRKLRAGNRSQISGKFILQTAFVGVLAAVCLYLEWIY